MNTILSIAALLWLGLFFGYLSDGLPSKHGLQWKIDELKERIRESERRARMLASVVFTIPRDTEGSMMRCLFTTHASPIRWINFGRGQLSADRCYMDIFESDEYIRFWCPQRTRKLAESCAQKVAE